MSSSHQKEVTEITIKLPNGGDLACKWWGSKNIQPIILIHGWQDNAGTFDTLIPLLPNNLSYMAIDLPGHGISSKFPNGTVYTTYDYLYILHWLTISHFNWPKVAIIGHSMGAIIGFLYASLYPKRVSFLIGLDTLKVHTFSINYVGYWLSTLDALVQADQRNIENNSEPTSYTYYQMIGKMKQDTGMLDIPAPYAPNLLQRGITKSRNDSKKYYFTRDARLKYYRAAMLPNDINLYLAQQIICPFMFIKALDAPYVENKRYFDETIKILKEKPTFELYGVPGDHHVHLTNPTQISDKIIKFIKRYYDTPTMMTSKL